MSIGWMQLFTVDRERKFHYEGILPWNANPFGLEIMIKCAMEKAQHSG